MTHQAFKKLNSPNFFHPSLSDKIYTETVEKLEKQLFRQSQVCKIIVFFPI